MDNEYKLSLAAKEIDNRLKLVGDVFITTSGETLTWDGNTDGLVIVDDAYYRVSGVVPTKSDFANGCTVVYGGKETSYSGERVQGWFWDDWGKDYEGFCMGDNFLVIPYDNFVLDEVLPFPKAGVYLTRTGDEYTSSLTIPGYSGFATTKINIDYIPELKQLSEEKVVKYSVQTLTEAEKATVKENIGVTDIEKEMLYVNPNIRAVAHRGYSTEAPENTISAYSLARKKGFTYVECDVAVTSDGVPVLLHDDTVNRTSNGTGSIANLTLEQVRSLDFGSWFSSKYAGEKIPTLEEFVIYCKRNGMHPYIEIKENVSKDHVPAIVSAVRRYDMLRNVTWISFSSTLLESVKGLDPKARLGYVFNTPTSAHIEWALSAKTDNNDVFLDVQHTQAVKEFAVECADAGIPLEVWTVNSGSAMLNLDPYISGFTSDSVRANVALFDSRISDVDVLSKYRVIHGNTDGAPLTLSMGDTRLILVSNTGEVPLTNKATSHTVYPVAVPEGATTVTVTCPDLRWAVRSRELRDGVWYATNGGDSGWQTVGGGTYTLRNIVFTGYIDICFSYPDSSNTLEYDVRNIKIEFDVDVEEDDSDGEIAVLLRTGSDVNTLYTSGYDYRITMLSTVGDVFYDSPNAAYDKKYAPIPVPDGATSVVVTCPSNMTFAVRGRYLSNGAWANGTDSGWLTSGGGGTYEIPNLGIHKYVDITLKYVDNSKIPLDFDTSSIQIEFVGRDDESSEYIIISGTTDGDPLVLGSSVHRKVMLSKVGSVPLTNNATTDTVYPITVPDGATTVTVTCPGLKWAVRSRVLTDGVWHRGTASHDSGWQTVGGGTFTLRSIPFTGYIDICFANPDDSNFGGDFDASTISIEFA